MPASTPEEANTPESQPALTPENNPLNASVAVNTEQFDLEARWDYGSLGIEDIPAALVALEERINAFEAVRSEINDSVSVDRFLEILAEFDGIAGDRYGIELRSELPVYADTKDEAAMAQ